MLLSSGLSFAGKGLKTLKFAEENVFVPERLGKVKLSHNGKRFLAKQKGQRTKIQNCFVDKTIRGVSQERLAKLMDCGYLSLNQTDDGEFTLKHNVRGPGGGPVLATLFYWATKVGLYSAIGGAVAGSTAAVVVTGGAAAPAVAGLGAAVGTGIGTAAASAAIGGAVVSTAVAGSAAATAAVGGTALAVGAGAGGAAGVIAAIEAAAIAAAAIGAAAGPF